MIHRVYNIEISDEEILEVAGLADPAGEVSNYRSKRAMLQIMLSLHQISKEEFLSYIQRSDLWRRKLDPNTAQ